MSQLSASQKSEWAHHVKEQQASGLTQSAYCQQHNLVLHQFGYWKRKLIEPGTPEPAGTSRFIPVKVSPHPVSRGLSITLPNGIIIQGIAPENHGLAQQLVNALS